MMKMTCKYIGVVVTQQCECTKYGWVIYLKMPKMINVLYKFHFNN